MLGAKQSGFSISTNDGGRTQRPFDLNCGHNGPLRARSECCAPPRLFFISISNRWSAMIGSVAGKYSFTEKRQNPQRAGSFEKCEHQVGGKHTSSTVSDISEVHTAAAPTAANAGSHTTAHQRRSTSIIAGVTARRNLRAVEGGSISACLTGGIPVIFVKRSSPDVRLSLTWAATPRKTPKPRRRNWVLASTSVGNAPQNTAFPMRLWARHVDGLTVKALG